MPTSRKPNPLDSRTLRWAARKAATYERELAGFERDATDSRQRAIYEWRKLTAFVLKSTYLSEARRLERKRKAKRAVRK